MLPIILLSKLFVIVALAQDFELQSGSFESGSGNFETGDYGFESGNSLSGFGGECGGSHIASRDPQNLSTPLYPRNYPNDLFCVWNIRTSSANERIYLIIHDFETEEPYDFVEVSTAITL